MLCFYPQYFCVFCTSAVYRGSSVQNSAVWIYSSLLLSICPPSPNYTMMLCTTESVCVKYIGQESCDLTHKMWLTDLVPFPISSGSCGTLTFPASGLYLNCEHRRLMAPWEIFISDAPHLSDLIQVCGGLCRSTLRIYSSPEQTRAAATNPSTR